jgi:hypothetical protein
MEGFNNTDRRKSNGFTGNSKELTNRIKINRLGMEMKKGK